ncbi:MAG: hypothetical protein MRZ54_01720, partial [Clostridiales bacterium]|nr:hypothetical protein [Clostridiales bacterium]
AVEKARYAIFSAETGFTCAYGAAGEPCKETLLRKASEPTAHVAGFGLQSEGYGPPTPPKGFIDSLTARPACRAFCFTE